MVKKAREDCGINYAFTENVKQLSYWMNFIHQPFHAMGEVLHSVTLCNPYMPLTGQWFKCNVQIAYTIALVFVVIALDLPRFGRFADPGFFNQLVEPLIEANQWSFWIMGLFILVQHIFHTGYVLQPGYRNTPDSFLPWLQVIF